MGVGGGTGGPQDVDRGGWGVKSPPSRRWVHIAKVSGHSSAREKKGNVLILVAVIKRCSVQNVKNMAAQLTSTHMMSSVAFIFALALLTSIGAAREESPAVSELEMQDEAFAVPVGDDRGNRFKRGIQDIMAGFVRRGNDVSRSKIQNVPQVTTFLFLSQPNSGLCLNCSFGGRPSENNSALVCSALTL